MATAKTKKATVRNPANRLLPGATSQKKKTKKRGATVTRKSSAKPKRRTYKRNPAGIANEMLLAFGGALVINGFDLGVNYFFPTVSGMVRTGGKFALGWLIGQYGRRLPIIGNFAPIIKNALWLAGALDLVSTYAVPKLMEWLGWTVPTAANAAQAAANAAAPKLIAPPQVVDTGNGQMGYLYQYDNGDSAIFVDERQLAY